MKKIINNKLYDTDTAKKIGFNCGSALWGDINFIKETLYQKRTGEYFLHGIGGAATKYAEPEGNNSWSAGERIMPMTFEEARGWAEKNLSADLYQSAFGAITEDGDKATVTFYLPVSAVAKLKRSAAESGKNQSELITELISKM